MAKEEKEQERKIIVDEDWKQEAQKEKEILAAREEAEKEKEQKEDGPRGPLPEGNFAALVSMLTTQALFALGLLQIKGQEQKQPDLELAKYNIDMLETLEEKTRGNLTKEEEAVLANTLSELRMGYVKRARQSQTSLDRLKEQVHDLPRCRNFYKAVTRPNPRGINVIAEVKKASPSAGVIREDFDPVAIAQTYERCGADAISVLTDEGHFQGRLEYIDRIRRVVDLPVLRKDFIIDLWQIYESRAAGADAILLIAEALKPGELMDLMIAANELSLTVLLEVHRAD
ncbi:MAG: DUF1844 domain-containing protein, partial [Planctomycetota bacterium]